MSNGDKHINLKVPDELLVEKARLEIEELKGKVADQKKIKIWGNYVNPVIPVAVTLLIGIWGFILTGKYNSAQLELTKRRNSSDSSVAQTQLKIAQTQLDISKQKNEADKELALTQLEISRNKNQSDKIIAQINASLSFVKLLQDVSINNPELAHQAKTVIAPALPPETSFNIALAELPDNPNALEVLFRTYKEESWKYIVPYAEYAPTDYLNNKPAEIHTYLFDFLNRRLLLKRFFNFLISSNYISPNRINSLVNYFDYIYKTEELSHNPAKSNELFYEVSTAINNTNDFRLKYDLAGASSIVFDVFQSNASFTELAAKYYWEKFDVSIGETSLDNSIDEFIYANRIIPNSQQILSNCLIKKLSKLNFTALNVDRIEVICYSYCESQPRGNQKVFSAFLQPNQSYALIGKVLKSLNNPIRKKDFASHLGSTSGDILFKNISQDKIIGKEYAELLISWYRSNWKKDWYIPKFFSSVIKEYPELKSKMSRKWGI